MVVRSSGRFDVGSARIRICPKVSEFKLEFHHGCCQCAHNVGDVVINLYLADRCVGDGHEFAESAASDGDFLAVDDDVASAECGHGSSSSVGDFVGPSDPTEEGGSVLGEQVMEQGCGINYVNDPPDSPNADETELPVREVFSQEFDSAMKDYKAATEQARKAWDRAIRALDARMRSVDDKYGFLAPDERGES